MSSFSRYMSHTTFQTIWNKTFSRRKCQNKFTYLNTIQQQSLQELSLIQKSFRDGIFHCDLSSSLALCTVSFSKSIRLKFRGIFFKRLEKIQRCSFAWKLAHQHKRLSSKIVRFLFLECKAKLIQHKRLNIYSIFFEITEASPCTDI